MRGLQCRQHSVIESSQLNVIIFINNTDVFVCLNNVSEYDIEIFSMTVKKGSEKAQTI